ncbi:MULTISPECIES: DUF5808 domain-containing protein [Vagococcus]|uniref:DUF1648 domain-containing protein n=1 Tax=Vagococcus fluvialis bH819 TaxID=1255619 RepID=A0A1X6WLG9_9ENTE|nr:MULTISPECIES: DUF5808 domain-containing protein [Vagococcus]SLM85082.1 hypothetical protein FM121_03225 [Vagococcus fluvialis bH819]
MINLIQLIILNMMIGLLLGITPFISIESMPFGISLPVNNQTKDMIKHQKKGYFILNMGISFILTLVIVTIGMTQKELDLEKLIYISIGGLFIQLFVSLLAYVMKNKQLKTYKKTLVSNQVQVKKVLVDLSFREEKIIFPTSYLVALNFIFIILTVGYTVLHFQEIPETFVTKWDASMNPVQWSQKSWASVLAIPAMQLFITFVMGIANYSFLKAKQQIDVNHPEQSVAQNKAFRKKSSLMNFVISGMIQILLMFVQMSTVFQIITPQMMMILSIIFTVLLLGLVLWLSFVYGQRGSRLKKVSKSTGKIDINNMTQTFDEDSHWKWGLVYFNPEDPSVWVEKRMGIGITTNFARWQTWVFMTSLIVLPIVIVLLMS